MPREGKRIIWSRNISPSSEKKTSRLVSFLAINRLRMRYKDTWICLIRTIRPDAFIANMVWQRICWHAADAKEWVNFHPTNPDSRLKIWRNLSLECHQPQPVTIPELNILISSFCCRDMCIMIILVPLLNVVLLMHLPRITSTIQILNQICWLWKKYALVSTLSAVWSCS